MKKLPPLDREGISENVRFLMKDVKKNSKEWTFEEVMYRISEARGKYTEKREQTYFDKKISYFLLMPLYKWEKNFNKHSNDGALVKD